MIDYEVELKKFKPAVGVEVGSDALFDGDVKDITDLVAEVVAELKEQDKKAN